MTFRTVSILALLALAGCTTTNQSSSMVGGFAGQPVRTAPPAGAAIVSAMAGGLVAGPAGQGLSASERTRAIEAEYRALEHTPVGQAVQWGDRAGGRYGEVVAAQPYRVGSQDCRQYTHTVNLGGQPRSMRGTACRNADGSWTPLT